MVTKFAGYIVPSATFDLDGIPDWGGSLLSADSAIVPTYNPKPEHKLAHHTENT
jgi:hypothetical protein